MGLSVPNLLQRSVVAAAITSILLMMTMHLVVLLSE